VGASKAPENHARVAGANRGRGVGAPSEDTPESSLTAPTVRTCAGPGKRGASGKSDSVTAPPSGRLSRVRLSEFWARMNEQFGSAYAESWSHDYVLAELGGRSVAEALAQGEDAKTVWRAVCAALNLPASSR
jgi:hypothetical protein